MTVPPPGIIALDRDSVSQKNFPLLGTGRPPGVHRSMKSGYIGGCIGGCIGGFGPRAAREARRPNELRSGEGTSIAAGKGQRRSHARGAIQAKSMEPNRTGGHRAKRV